VAAVTSNLDIARRLHLADKTVRNHVSNVFAKLRVSDRPQAIVRAWQAGLGSRAPGQAPSPLGTKVLVGVRRAGHSVTSLTCLGV